MDAANYSKRWFLMRPDGTLSVFSTTTRAAAETLARTIGCPRIVLCSITPDPHGVIRVTHG